jgi:hypothetical protein
MASVAYALHNQFSVPPQAEWETPADHRESKSSGRYIDLQEQLEASQCNEGIFGASPILRGVLDQVRTVASTDSTVLNRRGNRYRQGADRELRSHAE